MSKSSMAINAEASKTLAISLGVNNAIQATNEGTTLNPSCRNNLLSDSGPRLIASPQRIPPRNERIIAPYAISATESINLKLSLAINIAIERPTNGIAPSPPSHAAAEGTVECCSLVNLSSELLARQTIF